MSTPTESRSGDRIRFLQLGSLRIGAGPDPRLRLPPAQHAARQADRIAGLERAVRLALQRSVDFVLIPADLLEHSILPDAELDRVVELLSELAPRPVLISVGDSGSTSGDSAWNRELRRDRGRRPWPEHVHIFAGADWQLFQPKSLPSVCFLGRGGAPSAGTPDTAVPPKLPGLEVRGVLLTAGVPSSQKNLVASPTGGAFSSSGHFSYSDDEIQRAVRETGCVYVAMGRACRPHTVRSANGRVCAGDAGSAVADWPPMPVGTRSGALLAELAADGVEPNSVEWHSLDPRPVWEARADLSGATTVAEVRDRVLAAARAVGGPGDIVCVLASGLYLPGVELPPAVGSAWADPDHSQNRWHIWVDYSAVRPDFDLESLMPEPTPTAFNGASSASDSGPRSGRSSAERRLVAAMMERLESAENESATELIETTLSLGLEGLRFGRIGMRI